MKNIILFVFFVLINSCTIRPSIEVLLQRDIAFCKIIVDKPMGLLDIVMYTKSNCMYKLYNDYYRWNHCTKEECQQILDEWKEAWYRRDKQILDPENAYPAWMEQSNLNQKQSTPSYIQKKSLPKNFKTTDEVFMNFPNPCNFPQDTGIFTETEFDKAFKEYKVKYEPKDN